MSKSTDEKIMTVKSSKFEKIMTIISVGAIIVIPVIAFHFISSEFNTKNNMSQDSIEHSERMHKEYIDTIKASTSNIVEAIKSTNK